MRILRRIRRHWNDCCYKPGRPGPMMSYIQEFSKMAKKATLLLPGLDPNNPDDDDVVGRRLTVSIDGSTPVETILTAEQLQHSFIGPDGASVHAELFQSDAARNESPTPRTLDFSLLIADTIAPPTPNEMGVTIEESP